MPSQVESICSLPSGLLAPPGWDDLRDVLVDRRPRVVQRRRLQDDPGRPNWGGTSCIKIGQEMVSGVKISFVFSLSSLGICFPIQGSSGNVCGPVMRILGISRIFCCHIYLGIWIFATLCREYLKETWLREQNMGM